MSATNGRWMIGFLGLVAVVFIGGKLLLNHQANDERGLGYQTSEPSQPEFVPTWTYRDDVDQMRGTTTHNAYIESDDAYANSMGDDPVRTKLYVRRKGKGLDIFVSNENIQYTCSAYSDTYVSLKFDDGPVAKFSCTESTSSTYGMAFISRENYVLGKLKTAKKVIIETPVFQRGNIQQVFSVDGLKWN